MGLREAAREVESRVEVTGAVSNATVCVPATTTCALPEGMLTATPLMVAVCPAWRVVSAAGSGMGMGEAEAEAPAGDACASAGGGLEIPAGWGGPFVGCGVEIPAGWGEAESGCGEAPAGLGDASAGRCVAPTGRVEVEVGAMTIWPSLCTLMCTPLMVVCSLGWRVDDEDGVGGDGSEMAEWCDESEGLEGLEGSDEGKVSGNGCGESDLALVVGDASGEALGLFPASAAASVD